jgi:Macro domain
MWGVAPSVGVVTPRVRATPRLRVDQLGAHSVAFPAIAAGVNGFPPERAARIAVHTIASTPTNVVVVRLVAFDQATRDLLTAALGRRDRNHQFGRTTPWPWRLRAEVSEEERATFNTVC